MPFKGPQPRRIRMLLPELQRYKDDTVRCVALGAEVQLLSLIKKGGKPPPCTPVRLPLQLLTHLRSSNFVTSGQKAQVCQQSQVFLVLKWSRFWSRLIPMGWSRNLPGRRPPDGGKHHHLPLVHHGKGVRRGPRKGDLGQSHIRLESNLQVRSKSVII